MIPTSTFYWTSTTFRLFVLSFVVAATPSIGCSQQLSPIRYFADTKEPVTAVAWSADGKLAASGGDGDVRIWDIERGREVAQTTGYVPHGAMYDATGMAFSPDGRLLAFGSEKGVVKVWNWQSGTSTELVGQTRPIVTMAFSGDGRRLVTISGGLSYPRKPSAPEAPDATAVGRPRDKPVIEPMAVVVFDLNTRQVQSRVDAPGFLHAVFSADASRFAGPKLVVSDKTTWPITPASPEMQAGGVVEVREVTSGKSVRTVPGSGWRLALSPDGEMLLNGGAVWNVETGQTIREVEPNPVLFLDNGKRVLCVSEGVGVPTKILATPHWVRLTYVDVALGSRHDTGRLVIDEAVKVGATAFSDQQQYSPDRAYMLDRWLRLWAVPR